MEDIILLKEQANTVFKEAMKLNEAFNDAFSKLLYIKVPEKADVKFEELRSYEIGKQYIVDTFNGEKLYTTLIKKTEDSIEYILRFQKNGIFLKHIHSDCEEISTAIQGKGFKVVLGDKETDDYEEVIIRKGESIKIKRGVPHQFINLGGDESKLNVKFFK